MGKGKHCDPKSREHIKNLVKQGNSYRKVANLLNISKTMVEKAVKWVPKIETRGRKPKITLSTKKRIIHCVKKNPFISSKQIKCDLNIDVDPSTIRKVLIKENLKSRSPRKVPMLSKKNVQQRLKFAEEHVLWSKEKWRNIPWSDETKINLFNSDRGIHHVRRPPNAAYNPKYTIKTVKHGGGNIMVWGSFSYNGVGPLHRIQGIMKATDYVEILQECMLQYAEDNMPLRWIFQQDNDPKHTAKCTKEWFRVNNIDVMEWPPQSPDLNPIENLWNTMKASIRGKCPSNSDELWQLIQDSWNAIPVSVCRNLVDSMPKRCRSVLNNKGFSTKY